MTRQEKYDKLIERLSSAENYEKRPRAIWSEDDIEISDQRQKLENYLKIIETTIGDKKKLAENSFDILFRNLSSKLDKDGWK